MTTEHDLETLQQRLKMIRMDAGVLDGRTPELVDELADIVEIILRVICSEAHFIRGQA